MVETINIDKVGITLANADLYRKTNISDEEKELESLKYKFDEEDVQLLEQALEIKRLEDKAKANKTELKLMEEQENVRRRVVQKVSRVLKNWVRPTEIQRMGGQSSVDFDSAVVWWGATRRLFGLEGLLDSDAFTGLLPTFADSEIHSKYPSFVGIMIFENNSRIPPL
jgi:hypothetical protein